MSDLTPDDLARLRREAESASLHHYPLFSPETVLRLLDLAERTLRAEAEAKLLKGAVDAQDGRERFAGAICGVPWEEHGCDWPAAASDKVLELRAEVERLRAVLRGVSFQPAYHFTHVRENKRMADTTCEACDAVERVKAQARAAAEGRWDQVPPEARGEK